MQCYVLRNKLVCLTHYSDSSEETDTGTLQHHRSATVGVAVWLLGEEHCRCRDTDNH